MKKTKRFVTKMRKEPALRPDFIAKLKKLSKQKHKAIKIDDFASHYGLRKR